MAVSIPPQAEDDADAAVATAVDSTVVHVIQSSYHYRDRDNHPTRDEELVEEEGWFADAASAAARCDQLNAQNHTHYLTSMASRKREHDTKVPRAEQHNLEAAAIRGAGLKKDDVAVPPPFVPVPFEKFLAGTSYTSYEPLQIRRSDHDGIARAGEAHPEEKSGTEENATEGVASPTA
jgi:hypothetical protein